MAQYRVQPKAFAPPLKSTRRPGVLRNSNSVLLLSRGRSARCGDSTGARRGPALGTRSGAMHSAHERTRLSGAARAREKGTARGTGLPSGGTPSTRGCTPDRARPWGGILGAGGCSPSWLQKRLLNSGQLTGRCRWGLRERGEGRHRAWAWPRPLYIAMHGTHASSWSPGLGWSWGSSLTVSSCCSCRAGGANRRGGS